MTGTPMTAQDLAGRLSLEKSSRSWRGGCPSCSYPRVFVVKVGRDHQPLVFCANGCSADALDNTLARIFSDAWKPAPKESEQNTEAKRQRSGVDALRIWAGSAAELSGTPAARYLEMRGLGSIGTSAALRYRGDCYHPEGGKYPAMVALVQDAAGSPTAIHRHYLTHAGRKAAVEPPKASKGPIWGGAIRINPAAPEIVIGEGLETSASAGILLGLPAWAALSAGNLDRGLILPPEIQSVVIAADADPPGAQAARGAAARWRREGRAVRIAWPDHAGQDFNDILVARSEQHAA